MATQRNHERDSNGRQAHESRHVGAYEAKTHLSRLLDDVERGETIVITRRGVPIARLEPIAEDPLQRTRRVLARLRQYWVDHPEDVPDPPITTDEIVGWIRQARDERGDDILQVVDEYRRRASDADRS